jgi:hypothetical protein
LLKLYHAGATIAEVPTINDWRARRGQSKMRLYATVVAYLRVAVAHLAGRIQPPAISPLAGEEPIVETVASRAGERASSAP